MSKVRYMDKHSESLDFLNLREKWEEDREKWEEDRETRKWQLHQLLGRLSNKFESLQDEIADAMNVVETFGDSNDENYIKLLTHFDELQSSIDYFETERLKLRQGKV